MPVDETTQLLTTPEYERTSDGQSSNRGGDSVESSGRIRLAIFIAYLGISLPGKSN